MGRCCHRHRGRHRRHRRRHNRRFRRRTQRGEKITSVKDQSHNVRGRGFIIPSPGLGISCWHTRQRKAEHKSIYKRENRLAMEAG